MTVVVAFLCTDGVVVAADSMITPSMGGINVGHHHGKKVGVLQGQQVWAFAGDQGQAARFRHIADSNHAHIPTTAHPLDYPVQLSSAIIQQFTATGINGAIGVNTILGYVHGDQHHCCAFEGPMQPRLLDQDHFYVALGSGKMSADPFLRFLVDIFCNGNQQPKLRLALFLAVWTVQHVIDTNPGGVAGPIRVAILKADANGTLTARELDDNELAEHELAMESAIGALKNWRDVFDGNGTATEAPAPAMPTPGAAAT